jgi:hypothetical protein
MSGNPSCSRPSTMGRDLGMANVIIGHLVGPEPRPARTLPISDELAMNSGANPGPERVALPEGSPPTPRMPLLGR